MLAGIIIILCLLAKADRTGEERTWGYIPLSSQATVRNLVTEWQQVPTAKKVSLGSEACYKKRKGHRDGGVRVERPGVGVSMLAPLSMFQKSACSLSGIPHSPSIRSSLKLETKESSFSLLPEPHLLFIKKWVNSDPQSFCCLPSSVPTANAFLRLDCSL